MSAPVQKSDYIWRRREGVEASGRRPWLLGCDGTMLNSGSGSLPSTLRGWGGCEEQRVNWVEWWKDEMCHTPRYPTTYAVLPISASEPIGGPANSKDSLGGESLWKKRLLRKYESLRKWLLHSLFSTLLLMQSNNTVTDSCFVVRAIGPPPGTKLNKDFWKMFPKHVLKTACLL